MKTVIIRGKQGDTCQISLICYRIRMNLLHFNGRTKGIMGLKFNIGIRMGRRDVGKNPNIALYTFRDHQTIRSDFCAFSDVTNGNWKTVNIGNRTMNTTQWCTDVHFVYCIKIVNISER